MKQKTIAPLSQASISRHFQIKKRKKMLTNSSVTLSTRKLLNINSESIYIKKLKRLSVIPK